MHRHLLLVFAVFLSRVTAGQAPASGAIRGIVQDQGGNPVSSATVWLLSTEKTARFHSIPSAVTGDDGRFSIENLPFGEYRVDPMKEQDGYRNRAFDLYRVGHADDLMHVTLSAQTPVADNVVVVLGPKAGILKGAITDTVTRSPIAATVRISPWIILRSSIDQRKESSNC